MEHIKHGYKMTEVGVIPEDWDSVRLGKVLKIYHGKDQKGIISQNGIYPILATGGEVGRTNIPLYTKPSVLIGRKGTIDKPQFVDTPFWTIDTLFYSEIFDEVEPKFIFYKFQMIDWYSHNEASGVPSLNARTIENIYISLPSTLYEQRAIADTLSEVDDQITALDDLITKQRDIKQGAMQRLLTGEERLPGFSGEWVEKRLGKVAEVRKNRINPLAIQKEYFCVELEHIEQGTGRLINFSSTKGQLSIKSVFYPNDVLFGKLRPYLRKFWLADRSGVCSTEIWVLNADNETLTNEYLFYVIQTDKFIETASLAYGTHMPRADWNVIQNYELLLPQPEEQTAIAIVLSDMDVEISLLESKREKTVALKQGMMQELLTGKTRLI